MGVIATAVEVLIAAGVTGDALIAAVAKIEDAQTPARTKRQERNARYYQETKTRKASENRLNASETSETSESPSPPSFPPRPPQPPTPTRDITTHAKANPKPNGFALFWEAYPAKVAKRVAASAYDRAVKRVGGDDPAGVILAGVRRSAASRKWREGFVPNPSTWLNGDCWEDEPEPRQVSTPPPGQPATPAVLASRIQHFRDTGEWRPAWGDRPQEIAA